MDLAVQKCTGRQHHGLGAELDTDLRHGTDHTVAFNHQVIHRLLEQPKIGLIFQHAADRRLVQHPVGLGPCGAHGRAFAGIENTELDARLVRGQRHGTAQRVHFLDQVPLADATDGRVAAHLSQRLDVVAQQQRLATHAGGRQRSLSSGMAAANDDDIEFLWVEHGVRFAGVQGLCCAPSGG